MTEDSVTRVQKYLDRLATAKGYHKECIHTFLTGDGTEISLRASDLKELLQFVGSVIDDTNNTEAQRLAEMYDYGDPAVHSNSWKSAVCTELLRQHARIAELEQRLEIDPRHRYDGISARDATIKAQDERISELEAKLADTTKSSSTGAG